MMTDKEVKHMIEIKRKPCLQYTRTDEKCYEVTGDSHFDGVDLCDNCYEWYSAFYPQGWVSYPGDTCKHGTYVGGCGIDYMCNACEAWDDSEVDYA